MILVGTVIQIKDNIQSKVLEGLNKNKITLDGTGLIPDNKTTDQAAMMPVVVWQPDWGGN